MLDDSGDFITATEYKEVFSIKMSGKDYFLLNPKHSSYWEEN